MFRAGPGQSREVVTCSGFPMSGSGDLTAGPSAAAGKEARLGCWPRVGAAQAAPSHCSRPLPTMFVLYFACFEHYLVIILWRISVFVKNRPLIPLSPEVNFVYPSACISLSSVLAPLEAPCLCGHCRVLR